MISFHRILIFVALFAPLTTNVMSQSETPGAGATEGFREAKNYIDAAYGVAFLDGGLKGWEFLSLELRFSWADGRSSLKPCS